MNVSSKRAAQAREIIGNKGGLKVQPARGDIAHELAFLNTGRSAQVCTALDSA
jgi:hypothetical protein